MTSDAPSQAPESLRSVLASALPLLLDNLDFLERLHLYAVDLQKQGETGAAQSLFQLVRDHADRFPGLKAWAIFKDAEGRQKAGDMAGARQGFRHVLDCNPGHVKARLLLYPAQEQFRVMVGDRPTWPHPALFVPFAIDNLELWNYYFGHRLVDQLWITPPRRLLDWDRAVLAVVIRRHLAPNASIVLAMDNGRAAQLDSARLGEALTAGQTGFRAALEPYFQALLA